MHIDCEKCGDRLYENPTSAKPRGTVVYGVEVSDTGVFCGCEGTTEGERVAPDAFVMRCTRCQEICLRVECLCAGAPAQRVAV